MKKRWIIFIVSLILSISLFAKYQDGMFYAGEMDSWSGTSMTHDPDTNAWSVAIQSDGDDSVSEYKFRNIYGWGDNNVWSTQVATGFNEVKTANNGRGDNLATSNFNETNQKYYYFSIYDVDYGNDSQTVLQELSGFPNTISTITEPSTVYQDQAQTIIITLSGSKVNEEKVFLCYTTDNWSSRTNTEATGSGTSWSVEIPKQNIGTTVKFYAITTTSSNPWGDDEALYTLDHEYTQSSPYSYTVSDHNNQTYHTIGIDGQNDFSTANERSIGSSSSYWWYTWDEDNFYFALNHSALSDNNAHEWVVLYIDSDPQLTPTNGTGSTTGISYQHESSDAQQATLPFTANYQFQWNTDGSVFELKEFTESWVTVSGHNMQAYLKSTDNFFEVKIPLSSIDNPNSLYVSGFMLNENDGYESMWSFSPEDASIDNTDGYNKDIDSYWGFDLSSGETPNDSGNEDNPLPVTLSSFSAVYQGGLPVLNWVTSSENNNAGWNIYRSDTDSEEFSLQINAELIFGEGTTTELTEYRYEDIHECETGITYYYWLESLDYSNHTDSYGPVCLTIPEPGDEGEDIHYAPEMYGLHSNYPNPFNPSTTISFMLSYASPVSLEIFNLEGQKIASLLDQKSVNESEMQYITWDGRDDSGAACGSGMYFYRLSTDREINSQKMILIK